MADQETQNLKGDLQKEFIKTAETSQKDLATLQEMMQAGLMYGHKKTKTNPRFKEHYVHSTRNGIEIIDLNKTLPAMGKAIEFINGMTKQGGGVIFVATQPAAKEAVRNLAKKHNFSYINERWLGGLLTNSKVLFQRIEYFKKIQADFEKGEFDKYTKKERVMVNRDIHRMRKMFTGLENLTKIPALIFVVDASIKGHKTAIREARRLKIPIMAVIDSDDDPVIIDYPIPANDHAKMSIEWIMDRISNSLESDKSPESISNKSIVD